VGCRSRGLPRGPGDKGQHVDGVVEAEAEAEAHLDVLDHAVVAKVAAGGIARSGKGIWGNIQKGTVAAIGDVERSHRDWGWLGLGCGTRGGGDTSGLVAQIQRTCIAGFAVDSAHGGEEVVVMRGRIPLAPG
jgi:hypothetical protein